MDKEYDHLFKIVLIGNSQVGKSCILNRFTDNSFNANWRATIGADFKCSATNVNRLRIMLQVWDTPGQERFRSIVPSYYRDTDAFILVFNVIDAESFEVLSNWISDISSYYSERTITIIVGNKSDLGSQRHVTFEEARSFAERNRMNYIEVSAAEGHNIKHLFELLTRELASKLS